MKNIKMHEFNHRRNLKNILLIFVFLISLQSCSPKPHESQSGRDYEEFLYLKNRAEKHPDNMEIYLDLGEAYITLGQLDEAENCFNKILKTPGELPPSIRSEAHRRLGDLYLNSNRYDECREEIRAITKSYQWEREIFDMQGHYWYKMQKLDRGIDSYASELANPTCTDTFVGLGNIYRVAGDFENAEVIYKAGNVFDNECPFVRACLANLLVSQNKYKEAEKLLRISISTDPELGELYVYMGNLKRHTGNLREAIKWYKKALKTDRRSNEYAYAEMGNTYVIMAENEKKISLPLQTGIIFLFLITVSMSLFTFFHRKGYAASGTDRRISASGIFFLFLIALFLFEAAGFLILNGNNPAAKKFNPRSYYYHKAINSFDKAIMINPYRKDLRTNLAKAFRGIHRIGDAQAEEEISKLLPEYDLHARLRFIYP